jgi:hypothetical protein
MKRSKSFTIQRKAREHSRSKPLNSMEKPHEKPALRKNESVPEAIQKYIA